MGQAVTVRRNGQSPKDRALLVLVLILLAVCSAFVANRAWHAFQAYHRLQQARTDVRSLRPVQVVDWMPLRLVARTNRVPEQVLVDALEAAGFAVRPQPVLPDLPGDLPFGSARERARERAEQQRAARGQLLDPSRQSLRQIAEYSGRPPAEAVRVAEDAIRQYRQTNPTGAQAPSAPSAATAPSAPIAPPPSTGNTGGVSGTSGPGSSGGAR